MPNSRTIKLLVTAKYAGVFIDMEKDFVFGITNKSASFLKKNPFGKVPIADTQFGSLYESSAISYYLALESSKSEELLGKTNYEKALIQQYLALIETEINPIAARWAYPTLGYRKYIEADFKEAREETLKVLKKLDEILEPRTFLVGESITLADISVACSLILLYYTVLDEKERRPFLNLNRWFVTMINQPNFKSVIQDTSLIKQALTPKETCEESNKTSCKPSVAAAAVASSACNDDEEDVAPVKPKEKNPLDLLPPTAFNLEDWKRFYSNNDARPTSIDYFWKNYDSLGYCIYRIDYKYNNELARIFMSSNLVGGLFQRMERLRKYCFGSVLIFGEDNSNEISGYLVFRGQEIPDEMKDVADFESYNFRQMDINDPKEKELFNDYLAWDGELAGKKFADGKIFK